MDLGQPRFDNACRALGGGCSVIPRPFPSLFGTTSLGEAASFSGPACACPAFVGGSAWLRAEASWAFRGGQKTRFGACFDEPRGLVKAPASRRRFVTFRLFAVVIRPRQTVRMAQQRYQVFHEPAGARRCAGSTTAPRRRPSLAAARAADRARGGGACTLPGRPLARRGRPAGRAAQPAGWLVNAGSYRKDERHELHAQARFGRRSQAARRQARFEWRDETGVSAPVLVQIVDGACRRGPVGAGVGHPAKDGARDI